MDQHFASAGIRLLAIVLRAVGIMTFTGSVWLGPVFLMEGVTHWIGEGEIALPETPEHIHYRLTAVGCAVGTAMAGWMLARLGDSYRQPQSRKRFRARRLVAELLFLLGVAGLGIAALVGWGSRLAAYDVEKEYRRLGFAGAVAGPVLLTLGWVLFRRSAQADPASPGPSIENQ